MAKSVVWSEKALDDVDAIAAYIARDSKQNAASTVRKFLNTAASLGQFPHLGALVPELANPAIRERRVFRYRIIYRVKTDIVIVLAVIHSRRNFGALRNRVLD